MYDIASNSLFEVSSSMENRKRCKFWSKVEEHAYEHNFVSRHQDQRKRGKGVDFKARKSNMHMHMAKKTSKIELDEQRRGEGTIYLHQMRLTK